MAIILTENAARHVRNQILKRGKGIGLRLGVKRVGCSGLTYTMEIAESGDAQVIVDRDALQYLDGTKVDFRREGLSESFKFDNPNVAAECGCGESFSVENKSAGTTV